MLALPRVELGELSGKDVQPNPFTYTFLQAPPTAPTTPRPSALEPLQVSRLTCRFAGLTGGTVARAHSSLDSPRDCLASVCRLRNNVNEVVRELLMDKPELQVCGRPEPAASLISFLCYWAAVRSADSPPGR